MRCEIAAASLTRGVSRGRSRNSAVLFSCAAEPEVAEFSTQADSGTSEAAVSRARRVMVIFISISDSKLLSQGGAKLRL